MTMTRKRKFEAELEGSMVARIKNRRRFQNLTIVTWNMQGGGSDTNKAALLRRYMRSPDVVAICLQECGRLFDWDDTRLCLITI